MKCDFKEKYSFDERLSESTAIRKNHPNLVPIIVVRAESCRLPGYRTLKFNLDQDTSVFQLIFMIRAKVRLDHGKALFLIIGNVFPSSSSTLGQLYSSEAESDGFLYVVFDIESAFG